MGSFKAADGLLSFAGYSVIKNGPTDDRRKFILSRVFDGDVKVPNFLTDSVLKQWDQPKSKSRLIKMRNSLNIFKGLMEGRQNPSCSCLCGAPGCSEGALFLSSCSCGRTLAVN